MTVKEAECQYEREVAISRQQHISSCKKAQKIWNIISAVLIILGFILLIVGCSTPTEIDYFGNEWDTSDAILEKMFGSILLFCGVIFIITINICAHKSIERGPKSFLPQIKNLYCNYLKCDDINQDDKEFYKQKLEDIRNAELVGAIHSASATASAAIMLSLLKR